MSSQRLSTGKTILFSTIVLVMLLGGLELGLRTWANYFRLAYLTYDRKLGRPVLVPNAQVITTNERFLHVSLMSRTWLPIGLCRWIKAIDQS